MQFITPFGKLKIHTIIFKLIYNTIGVPHLGTRMRLKILSQLLEKINLQKAKVLDAGCGYGFTSFLLAKKGYQVTAVDKDVKRLTTARKIAVCQHLSVNFLKANIYHLPFASRSFELVTCFEVLEHLKNDTKALRELTRVVKNNGYLIISSPKPDQDKHENNKREFRILHHLRSGYTSFQLSHMLKGLGMSLVIKKGFGASLIGKLALYLNLHLGHISIYLRLAAFLALFLMVILGSKLSHSRKYSNLIVIFKKYSTHERY